MEERPPARRIRHAKETIAALEQVWHEPTPANVAALHELHASHLRETGDEAAAARADERAEHARQLAATPVDSSSGAADDGQRPQKPVGEASSARYALAGSQRADAALQRAVEGSERSDAHAARDKAGRERSAAARRRLRAAGARAGASALRSPPGETEGRADERDRVADEREQLADERDRLADERDSRADSRDKVADRRERAADERDRADKRPTP